MKSPRVTRLELERIVILVLLDQVGAGARLAPELALALPARRWGWQPKVDGCYARVSLDRRGRVANVLSRAGRPIPEARDLIGILAGPSDSVLHGELEAHTEAGNRLAACRGWRALHLFDCTRSGGRDVTALAYSERYGLLHQAQAEIELAGRCNPWVRDDEGDWHDAKTGRYTRPVPRDVRRLPVVPLARGKGAGEALWREHVEVGGGEGLVAVRLDAPARARGAKRKVKLANGLDCRVVSVAGPDAILEYGGRMFAVRCTRFALAVGMVVECQADGFYERDATPRFPRIVRVRSDLAAVGSAA